MGPVVETTATPTVSSELATGARLIVHLKENNIQYLLATLMLKVTHGKMFRTRSGRYGCYKYHNGRKVKFVTRKPKARRNRSYSKRRY